MNSCLFFSLFHRDPIVFFLFCFFFFFYIILFGFLIFKNLDDEKKKGGEICRILEVTGSTSPVRLLHTREYYK